MLSGEGTRPMSKNQTAGTLDLGGDLTDGRR
jgi:hypothetical protein